MIRHRRNRKSPWIREILAENRLVPSDLIYPLFVISGNNEKQSIQTMPGVERYTVDLLIEEVKKAYSMGIKAVALFPSIDKNLKDENGSEALNENNLICNAIKTIKDTVPEVGIICDIALDPYTSHGHDGVIKKGVVANDETVEILKKQALVYARAGCDIVAPSDMMDGRIGMIREELELNNFKDVNILAYSAKYASNFYGPFRDAVGSKSCLAGGDKKNYQMDYRNSKEAILEIEQDINEGADMVMVKPALAYLDIIREAANNFSNPIFAYQVSGEYSMLKFAAERNCCDFESICLETLIAIKRSGAKAILTYAALVMAENL
jgi:porphobilinogen synthase